MQKNFCNKDNITKVPKIQVFLTISFNLMTKQKYTILLTNISKTIIIFLGTFNSWVLPSCLKTGGDATCVRKIF